MEDDEIWKVEFLKLFSSCNLFLSIWWNWYLYNDHYVIWMKYIQYLIKIKNLRIFQFYDISLYYILSISYKNKIIRILEGGRKLSWVFFFFFEKIRDFFKKIKNEEKWNRRMEWW